MQETKSLKPPADKIDQLPPSLQHIARALEKDRYLKPADMRRIVLQAEVQIDDLLPWADFDHPVTDSYGRRLIYQGDNFEIMTMSWAPGDFSTIHDHGYTQWGCVQVFGPAEHATFRMDDQSITTLARWQMKPGEAIGVHHDLLHQMGNATDERFLSLHVYGEPEDIDNVTGDARILDLEHQEIQLVDGGVFFALPPEGVKKTLPAPPADFPTRLRHLIELARRLYKMDQAGQNTTGRTAEDILALIEAPGQRKSLLHCLRKHTDEHGHHTSSVFWRNLIWELKEAAKLQNTLGQKQQTPDNFDRYAELYDAVIGQPCLDDFMANYLRFFGQEHRSWQDASILSLGVGTGLTEQFLQDELGVPKDHIYGIDISQAMVEVARQRLQADQGDILTLDPAVRTWDIAYSGLNVFHYLPYEQLSEAIERTAAVLNPGGYFVGDFITPDHIRWYPNVLISEDEQIISLRTPQLIEDNGRMFQESEIINIDFRDEQMQVSYAGKHKRFLPPLHRVRLAFEQHFDEVMLYDAHSLKPIPEWADSCTSTRYVVIAKMNS